MSQVLPTVPPTMPETTAARLVAVDHPVTHDEWVTEWTTREERYELVDGIPLMTPPEHPDNVEATSELAFFLRGELGNDWRCLPGVGVRITAGPRPTYRVPDLVVQLHAATRELPLDPAHVALIVEALSPSTRDEDLGRKRRDYASVGIPSYLILDRRHNPHFTLLTDPGDEDYCAESTGDSLTLHIAGRDITIHANDLFR